MIRPTALASLLIVLVGCSSMDAPVEEGQLGALHPVPSPSVPARYAGEPTSVQRKIVEGARDQLNWGTRYDNAYYRLEYPGGDLPRDKGVCTDVVVRALRQADLDLQQLVHEDMKRAWAEYPRYAGHTRPDWNIDHRRVPNLMRFFKRHGLELTKDPARRDEWQPRDIVCWNLNNGLDHVGVLSDRLSDSGLPLVVHNLGTTTEDDVLDTWKIVGHFRYPKPE
jgi:uncharacterized protein